MYGELLDAILTASDPATVAGAFIWAYGKLRGTAPPRKESWLYPLALAALETAHFTAMYNYNPGNITDGVCGGKVHGTAGTYTNPAVTVPLKFAAFRTLGEGCFGELETLSCMGALKAADQGDYAAFMKALETGCYAGCQPYPDISAYVSEYKALTPVPYSSMTNAKAAAIGTGLVLLAGAGAWLITRSPAPPAHRGLAMHNPATGEVEPMKIQSLLFSRAEGWTAQSAKKWAKAHGYKTGDVDETERFIHLRQRPPGGMRVVRTKPFGNGISARVGRA